MNAHPYLLRLAAGLALLLPAACTSPAPPAPNLTALFADALHCRGDFPDARDRATAERLRAEGVEVLDRAPGETLDLLYRFATPLRIDGSLVNAVRVRGDSGVLVMAYAEATSKTSPGARARRRTRRNAPRWMVSASWRCSTAGRCRRVPASTKARRAW